MSLSTLNELHKFHFYEAKIVLFLLNIINIPPPHFIIFNFINFILLTNEFSINNFFCIHL